MLTGRVKNSATDANVSIEITGAAGKSGIVKLAKSKTNRDKFESGKTDVRVSLVTYSLQTLCLILTLCHRAQSAFNLNLCFILRQVFDLTAPSDLGEIQSIKVTSDNKKGLHMFHPEWSVADKQTYQLTLLTAIPLCQTQCAIALVHN